MPSKEKPAPPRAIIIHGLAHARIAAAEARALGVAVRLRSADGAGAFAGAAWFREIAATVRAEFPDVDIEASLDCADFAGHALAALRQGIELVRFRGPKRVREKVAAIAEARGAALDTDRRKALDLFDEPAPEAACRAWLGDGERRQAD